MRLNTKQLVKVSITGKVDHPIAFKEFNVDADGKAYILPGIGGITYNVRVGDNAFGWQGDHIEPGVSIKNDGTEANVALNTLACIGNEAIILTGDAKGSKGYVSGKHGGVDHIIVSYEEAVLEKMSADETILIKSFGQGLKVEDYPSVHIMNIDPIFFEKCKLVEAEGKLQVPVKSIIPGGLMGSGTGSQPAYLGDCDIMTSDMETVLRHKINELCLGDVVFIEDYDSRFGRGYAKGISTVGVVIHCDSRLAGHGPGITTIMTGDILSPIYSESANLVNLFDEIK